MTDPYEPIAAALDRAREKVANEPMKAAYHDLFAAMVTHAEGVLARHARDGEWCGGPEYGRWPCAEVRALADLWLPKGWDQ